MTVLHIEDLDTGVASYADEWVSVEGLGPYDAVVPDLLQQGRRVISKGESE